MYGIKAVMNLTRVAILQKLFCLSLGEYFIIKAFLYGLGLIDCALS